MTHIPGAILGRSYSGKWFFGAGVLVTAIAGVFIPLAAAQGPAYVVALRVVQGLGSVSSKTSQ